MQMISLWSCQSILSLSESFKWQLQHIFSLCDMHLFVLIEPRNNIWPHMALSNVSKHKAACIFAPIDITKTVESKQSQIVEIYNFCYHWP